MQKTGSLRIGLIGYGKMGKAVEHTALSRGHVCPKILGSQHNTEKELALSPELDVCIEFTNGDAAFQNISACVRAGIPVVSGSTGWLARFDEIVQLVREENGAFFYASNFSIGVHLFMQTARKLSQLMNGQGTYEVLIEESHHIYKKDAPSGTAISLAELVLSELEGKDSWKMTCESTDPREIPVIAKRLGNEPGYHRLTFHSPVDMIGVDHRAFNRDGFALGAVMAAEFVADKSGLFGMEDLLEG